MDIAVRLPNIRQRTLRDIGVIDAIANRLPGAGIACRHVKPGAQFNRQMVAQGVVMVVFVVALPVISALVWILVLDDGVKRVMIVHAGAYLREARGSQDTGGKGRDYQCEPNERTGTRRHRVITLRK